MKTNQKNVVVTLSELGTVVKVYTMESWAKVNKTWRESEDAACADDIKMLDDIINDIKDVSISDISFTRSGLFSYTASINLPKYKYQAHDLNRRGLNYAGGCLKFQMRDINYEKAPVVANSLLFNARRETQLYKNSLYRKTFTENFKIVSLVEDSTSEKE